ncbi:MAG: hypothetical protein JXQ76_05685 [Campylobacterales bacterium]|nr:hypothetical protein [Campylobacterales bacterium]
MKITANEFDKRFDNGEDVFDLMENPKVMKLQAFENEYLKNTITINFSEDVYNKIKEKANILKVSVDDLIKIIVAERVGIV